MRVLLSHLDRHELCAARPVVKTQAISSVFHSLKLIAPREEEPEHQPAYKRTRERRPPSPITHAPDPTPTTSALSSTRSEISLERIPRTFRR